MDIAGATLTDAMFGALTSADFTIEPSTGYVFTYDSDKKVTGITFTAVEDGKNTQKYTIKYSTGVTENADGSISPVTNAAELKPGEGKDGNPIGAESTVTPEEVQLTKTGTYENWNNSQIKWTITVNEGNRNIAGAVLTDTMFSKLTAEKITISDETWQRPNASEYTIGYDEDGKLVSITFKAIAETGVNTKKYIITYYTTEYPQWEKHYVHNEANLNVDGKDIDAPADAEIPRDGTVAKSATAGTVSEDGNTMTIPWTVTLNVPKGGLPKGATIVDDVTKNHYGNTNLNQWMTRNQICQWTTNMRWTDDNGTSLGNNNTYTPPSDQVTFKASDGNTYTYEQIAHYDPSSEGSSVDYGKLTYTLLTIYFPEGLTPPEGATRLTFTYSTTVDLNKTTTGRNVFYNDIKVNDQETSAESVYFKSGVSKTDGNGNTSNTTVSNEGELTWKVTAAVGEGYKKLTLTDTLPNDVTLESLRLTGWNNLDLQLTDDENGNLECTGNNGNFNVSGTYQGGIITVDITAGTEGSAIQTGATFTLIVNCRVTDAEKQTGTITLTNTANMKLDEVEIGSASQTQEWTYKKEEVITQVVDKSGSWDNGNRVIDYTIILNPEGKTLLDGQQTLTLVDTLSYLDRIWLNHPFDQNIAYSISADLIQSSVKLYEAHWDETNGNWVADTLVTGWSWIYEKIDGEGEWGLTTNTITATGIPDGKTLMFRYSYRISSNVPDEENGQKVYFDLSQKFNNKAKLEGTSHYDESSSSNMKWESSSSSAGVTTDKSYTFYKVEKGNYGVTLAGAVFSVYKYDTANSTYSETPVYTYATNDSGIFHITREEKNPAFTYDYNTLYKVVETKPPVGYCKADDAKDYYFYFSNTTDTEHTLPGSDILADAVDLSSEAKTVYVENVKNTTEITVEKVWKDANGSEITAPTQPITINLYQRTTKTSGSGGGDISGSGETATVTATAKNNASVTASKIKADAITVGSKIQIKVEIGYPI